LRAGRPRSQGGKAEEVRAKREELRAGRPRSQGKAMIIPADPYGLPTRTRPNQRQSERILLFRFFQAASEL